MTEPGFLGPGIARLRPDDHFMVLSETDASPQNIGALIVLDVPAAGQDAFASRLREHIIERLPLTPLLSRLEQCPNGYDSDVWVNIALPDPQEVAEEARSEGGWTDAAVRNWVTARSMERLDLSVSPFKIFLLPDLIGDRAAMFIKVHHGITDGIGFQTILRYLSDDSAAYSGKHIPGVLPDADTWQQLAEARFTALAAEVAAHKAGREAALTQLRALREDPARARSRTPVLKMSGPTSSERAYATWSVSLDRMKAVSKTLGGTINDLFISIGGGMLRQVLLEIDDLPSEPLVINAGRSYRQPEHGDFGNRIMAIHPHIGTHIADPVERFRAIQRSMDNEHHRAHLDQAMLGQPESPYGARDRRRKYAERLAAESKLLPGNVSLSNVTGPAHRLSYAGFAQAANYPVPIIGAGRFLNITSRRNADMLDMGIMVDPTRIRDVEKIPALLEEALAEHEACARLL
jgi:diacylglycerol O-acyltransferase